MTEDRGQIAEVRRLRSEDREKRRDNRGNMADNRGHTLENRNQMAYLYNQSTDRTEGAEGSDFSSAFCHLSSVLCLLSSKRYN